METTLQTAGEALRLPPLDAEIRVLSGGEKRRVALACVLLGRPDMLLLDEPTNHLDAESVAWLERFLLEYPATVIAVTHDRYFLDNVAGWILELDRGRGYPFKGNYTGWLEQKSAGWPSRKSRKVPSNENSSTNSSGCVLARGRVKLRAKPASAPTKAFLAQSAKGQLDSREMCIPPGPRLGDLVVQCEDLSKGFGERLLIDGLTFRLPKNGIVGVIGPNGAGKTTLFRMLIAEEQPDGGKLVIGETVQFAYVDQSRERSRATNVWQEISKGEDKLMIGGREIASRAYCSWFGFRGSDQQKPVGKLSGGERNRVILAKLLKEGGNVVLLDEPTNDLDVDTLRSLEEALLDFAGCAVVISHDRWFLDRYPRICLRSKARGKSRGSRVTIRRTRRTDSGDNPRRTASRGKSNSISVACD